MLVDVLQVAEEYLKILICVVEEHKENPVCHTLVPHIDEKAIDDAELATCIVEDSSPLESDYESLDYTPPRTPHSLSTLTSTLTPQENIEAKQCYSNLKHVSDIPHASPQKKKTCTQATPSIRVALEAANHIAYGNPQDLLRFWKKGSQETIKEYWNKVQEEWHDADEEEAFAIKAKQN